jgi:tRNA-specific 2-thiouridylase
MASATDELAAHLSHPLGCGHVPVDAYSGAAGGAACGDLLRISVALDASGARVADAGFAAEGCAAARAAGSAAVALVRGRDLLAAARVGEREISDELGGLTPAGAHAAELACDALHRALGHALRGGGSLEPSPGRTAAAMSGGVDSATAALLASAGGEAVGITLELWSDPENDGELSCCSAQSVRAARSSAHAQGMAHFSIDLREEFRAGVVEPWLEGHAAGLTPNPCVRCNGRVRLDAMLDLADRLGAATLATGHYARVAAGPLLRRAADCAKDQSYVLCALSPASLERLRFPLGEMTKPDVRALAEREGISVARRPDSQDLCFLAGTGSERFLLRHGGFAEHPGPILDASGHELGRHGGAHLFTVGQRRGIGVTSAEPLYVLATDARANSVTVGGREALCTSRLELGSVDLRLPAERIDAVQIRAHGRAHPARLRPGSGGEGTVVLTQDIERTAPGQIACLYSGDLVAGHGVIRA